MRSYQITKLRVPLGREIGDNNCAYETFDVCALRLEGSSGTIGWGFGPKAHGGRFAKPVSWKAEMPSANALREEMERVWPRLKGLAAEDAFDVAPPSWEDFGLNNALHMALRMALWDLRGREAGVPARRLMPGGGEPAESVFAYASPCAYPQTDAWTAEFLRSKVEAGFRAVKVKVGAPDIERDLRRLRVVREAVGPETELSVDGNTAWDAEGALRWMERVRAEGFELAYVEDPIWPDDLDGYRRLARQSPMRIVGHDYISDPRNLPPLLDTGAISALHVPHGIDYALAAAEWAERYDVGLIQGNTFGEHSIQFALTHPRIERMEFADLGWNDLFEAPARAEGGRMVPPPGDGLGLVPTEAALREWRVPDDQ